MESKRQRSTVLTLAGVFVLLWALGRGQAQWAAAMPHGTVPRETPTRVFTPTATLPPSATATLPPPPPATDTPVPLAPPATNTPAPPVPPATATLPAPPVTTAVSSPVASATPAATSTAAIARTPAAGTPAATPSRQAPTPGAVASPAAPIPASSPQPALATPAGVAGGICPPQAGQPDALRLSGDRAHVVAPPDLAPGLCLYLREADLAPLPPAPEGFDLGSFAVSLRAADPAGNALPSAVFTGGITLTFKYTGADITQEGGPLAGYLEDGRTAWALLVTDNDESRRTVTVHPERPGTIALLTIRSPLPQLAAQPPSDRRLWWIGGGAAAALAGLGVALFLSRRSRAAHSQKEKLP